MPIRAQIYTPAGTSREQPGHGVLLALAGVRELVVINAGPYEIHDSDSRVPVMIVDGYLAGSKRVVPAMQDEDTSEWEPMLTCPPYGRAIFGGAFVFSSDSKFPSQQPLPLHDRYETPEMADLLSR